MKNNRYKTVGEVADLWKEDKRPYVKRSSFSVYVMTVENHILPVFGGRRRIEEAEIQAFALRKMQEGMSRKSVRDILTILKMIQKFGAKKGWLPYPDWNVRFPAEQKSSEVQVLSVSHQRRIMRHVIDNFTFRNLGIYLCLATGMRIGEVCALKWGDIGPAGDMVSVRRTIGRIYVLEEGRRHTELVIGPPKTRHSVRDIPVDRELAKLIRPLKKVMNDDFFVLTNDSVPIEPRTYRCYYKKLLRRLGVPDLKFHGLRHSFATRCIESRCDYKTVSVLLGHSDISTTLNLYVHPNLEQKKKCIDRMFRTLK